LTNGDGSIRVLDYASMDQITKIQAHTTSTVCLEVDPSGKYLAVGGSDSLITLWTTDHLLCKRGLPKMQGPVRNVSFSWCGGYLVGGTAAERGLHIVHAATGEYLHTINCGPTPVLQWSPKDYSLAYAVHEPGNQGGLRIINGAALI
jgi:THO complex subunit 3